MARPGPWAPEVTARARALWDEGLSAAAIGREIGCTKNAVIGKAWREDWPGRPSPIRPRTVEPTPRAPKVTLRSLPPTARTTPRIAEAVSTPTPLPTAPVAFPGHPSGATGGGAAAPPSAAGARAPGEAAYGGPVAAPVAPAVPVTVFRPRRVVERQCAWLLNDRHPWRQCEAVTAGHGVYCEHHRTISRAAVQPRQPGAWA